MINKKDLNKNINYKQDAVFSQCGVMSQVERSLDGYASLIFAFGQTGAGKTYTMVRNFLYILFIVYYFFCIF